jgi:hypothetical protein
MQTETDGLSNNQQFKNNLDIHSQNQTKTHSRNQSSTKSKKNFKINRRRLSSNNVNRKHDAYDVPVKTDEKFLRKLLAPSNLPKK